MFSPNPVQMIYDFGLVWYGRVRLGGVRYGTHAVRALSVGRPLDRLRNLSDIPLSLLIGLPAFNQLAGIVIPVVKPSIRFNPSGVS